jgi:hypothetical protein
MFAPDLKSKLREAPAADSITRDDRRDPPIFSK